MNTPILRMSRLVGALFAILLVASTLIQYVQAPGLRAMAGNKRTTLDTYSRDRGQILVGDQPIAVSTPATGELAYLRSYPHILFFPSLFLSLCVLAFIMLGDAARDAFDPKSR